MKCKSDMASEDANPPRNWRPYIRHVGRISQRAICLLCFEVIVPALIYRYFTQFLQPIDFASWMYLAATINVGLPGFKDFFRSKRCLENPVRDVFQSIVIWLIYRFGWFPVNRLADYLVSYYALPCYTNSCWLPVVNMLLACIAFVTSAYYAALIGETSGISQDQLSADGEPSSPVYYLPINRQSMKRLLCGLQRSIQGAATVPAPKAPRKKSPRRRC